MRLLVNTIDTLQVVGLTTLLNQYTPIAKDIPDNCVGVVFDNESLLCAYVPAGADVKFDRKVVAVIGIDEIRDILSGVVVVKTQLGSAIVRPHERTVSLKNTGTLTFDDIENIRAHIQPSKSPDSLVGSTVVFDYYKRDTGTTRRVVVVKEQDKKHLSGLDVIDGFEFKTFLLNHILSLKEVR